MRNRRLTEAEYRILGEMLRAAANDEKYATTIEIIRQITMTGCRRSEVIGLTWSEVDTEGSCLRLADSKEGASVRPVGLPVVEFLEARRKRGREGRKPESVFDFVQGITAVARHKTHQDARLDMEARAKKLLDRAT